MIFCLVYLSNSAKLQNSLESGNILDLKRWNLQIFDIFDNRLKASTPDEPFICEHADKKRGDNSVGRSCTLSYIIVSVK